MGQFNKKCEGEDAFGSGLKGSFVQKNVYSAVVSCITTEPIPQRNLPFRSQCLR